MFTRMSSPAGWAANTLGKFVCVFLQAEDGLGYWSVTGVQTCALPISPGFVLDLDLQRVELSVLRNSDRLKREQIDQARALEELVERRREVVRVLQELSSGLLREIVERVLSVDGCFSGCHLNAGPEAADVDRVDDAVGSVEETERAGDDRFQIRVAEAAVVVYVPRLPPDAPSPLLRAGVGRDGARELAAVESLGQIEDVLSAGHCIECERELR